MNRKTIAGVCGGFADYLGVDVVLVRIVWLCAAIFTGLGFIAYVICWIVMPKDYGPALVVEPEAPPFGTSAQPTASF